ncbi:hypothetical protein [Salipaludibacillus daqingensis]|uniref:hypothetical protein n=1 Tax=Salipaludibacillus daqingensis TaxID=3041001 RepID=UPI002473D436|nr:hypothetical protein [Salipaludibacillus daqingensis]
MNTKKQSHKLTEVQLQQKVLHYKAEAKKYKFQVQKMETQYDVKKMNELLQKYNELKEKKITAENKYDDLLKQNEKIEIVLKNLEEQNDYLESKLKDLENEKDKEQNVRQIENDHSHLKEENSVEIGNENAEYVDKEYKNNNYERFFQTFQQSLDKKD